MKSTSFSEVGEEKGADFQNFGFSMAMYQTRNIGHPLMNLVRLKGFPILQQLKLEERLLRNSSDNWCIINDGTDNPAIVMGVSGKPDELLDIKSVLGDQIPVIRRFTGGGTVIVDHNTVFVTFICNKDAVSGLKPFPQPIMSWSSLVYNKVFQGTDFYLRENDYVFGNRKFGGNAQSITKSRWIHHTSFLWDYEVRNMAYLKHPKRVPDYREARSHLDFLCSLKEYMPRQVFIDKTIEAIETEFATSSKQLEECENSLTGNYNPTTRMLTEQELETAAGCVSQDSELEKVSDIAL